MASGNTSSTSPHVTSSSDNAGGSSGGSADNQPPVTQSKTTGDAMLDDLIIQRDKAEAAMNLLEQKWENAQDEKTKDFLRDEYKAAQADYRKLRDEVVECQKAIFARQSQPEPNPNFVEQNMYAARLENMEARYNGLVRQVAEYQITHHNQPKPDPDFVAFWRALCGGKAVLSDNGQFLNLPDGVFILGDSYLGSSMMVRACYKDLYKIVSDTTGPVPTAQWVITGNPGIGKTFFSAYVLWLLAQQHITVVYEPAETNKRVDKSYLLLPDGSVEMGTQSGMSFANTLKNPNTWLIADAHSPSAAKARTLLVTSPRRDTYNDFIKLPRAGKRYMPVWTWDEIEACRSTLFAPRVTLERARDLFNMCGGIPRHVLESTDSIIDVQNEMLRGINKCDLKKCQSLVGGLDGAEDFSHRMMHICLMSDGTPYNNTRIMFASSWMAEQVVNRLLVDQRNELLMFLRNAAGEDNAASLRGQLFEGYAHNLLRNGGSFTWRRIRPSAGAPPKAPITLPQSTLRPFSDLTQVDLTQPDIYYRPMSKNLAAVDALASGGLLFQMTVSDHHDIKMDGLKKALERIPATIAKPKLVFVVPEDVFSTFAAQNYVTQGHTIWRTAIPPRVKATEQWALEIPL